MNFYVTCLTDTCHKWIPIPFLYYYIVSQIPKRSADFYLRIYNNSIELFYPVARKNDTPDFNTDNNP